MFLNKQHHMSPWNLRNIIDVHIWVVPKFHFEGTGFIGDPHAPIPTRVQHIYQYDRFIQVLG